MNRLVCEAKAAAKAIGGFVAAGVAAYVAKKGFTLDAAQVAAVSAAAAGVVVYFTRNTKCGA